MPYRGRSEGLLILFLAGLRHGGVTNENFGNISYFQSFTPIIRFNIVCEAHATDSQSER